MGALFSKPKSPKVPDLPPPVEAPPPVNAPAAVQAASDYKKKTGARARATILTGPQGLVATPVDTTQKVLLGS